MKNKNMIVGLLAVGVIAGVALLLGTDKGKKLSITKDTKINTTNSKHLR